MQLLNPLYYKEKGESCFYVCHFYSLTSQNFLNKIFKPEEKNILAKYNKKQLPSYIIVKIE